jgi:hypothetical protein
MPTVEKLAPQAGQSQLQLADIPIAQDAEKAVSSELAQLQDSAEKGDLNAQARLGVMYYWGEGAPMDWDKAKAWLRKASERGNADAQAKLGAMCFLGQGGPRDLDESIKWFRAAAEQGEPYAQGCMGVMYAVGEGVPKDLVQAYVWLLQAQAGGDTDAAEPFQQVKLHMTPAQLKEADRLASQAMKNRATD